MQQLRSSFCKTNQPNKVFEIDPAECDTQQQNAEEDRINIHLPALAPIKGTIVGANLVYSAPDQKCIVEYDITIRTEDSRSAHFTITGYTYLVDCGELTIGVPLIGFYDTFAPIPAVYPPTYNIFVLAFDYPSRKIKADYFDCNLLSQDHSIQLVITPNTYIVDKEGQPYCGPLQNKYLVILYDTDSNESPAPTTPNVVIVLSEEIV